MIDHRVGSREEWLAERTELLEAEKELTRRSDELARQRQQLPWVRVDEDYTFDTESGPASLPDADLRRRSDQWSAPIAERCLILYAVVPEPATVIVLRLIAL